MLLSTPLAAMGIILIPLAEYARRKGRLPSAARHMAHRGGFTTAKKMGRDWFVEEEEPWPDRRVTHGKYRDKYAKIRAEYQARKEAKNKEEGK